MQFNLEKLEQNFVMLEVTAEPKEIDEALAESYKVVVNKVSLPGFRKGHIPRHILEAQLGKGVLYEDAIEILVTKGYLKGLEEYKLEPIAQPKLEVEEAFTEGKPFVFKAKIEVLPEVKLGQYKNLEIEKIKPVVEESQVDERLKALQERHAELVLSEKEYLEKGDFAVIDFEGYIDGKPFPGGASQGYSLEIGSGSFIPGFEDQLVGMKTGSEKEIRVTFPEDYPNKELAGKEAAFKVSLKEIKVKEIPALDDEFAQSVGKFETLDQLKADLRDKLMAMSERDSEANFAQAVVDKAAENSTVELPETLIHQEMHDLLHRFEHNLAYQGLTLEKYLAYAKKTEEQVMEDFRPEAIKRVKTDLVLNTIAKIEDIQVTDNELDEKIRELASLYEQKNPEKFRKDLEKNGRLTDIKQAILLEKTADFLKEQAKVIEK
ncbi:MAG: trigger factor [Bacillota bacterium]